MSRAMDYGGIGRGRHRSGSGSSSSGESYHERPAPIRIPSPALSDDGDTGMQAVENDDTPPPPSRPLLRQAMAFSANQPPETINTYVAEVPEIGPKPDFFLPGQKVPIPPKPKPEKPKKPVKPKRPEAYPGQVTKFRLNASYDPTPSADPPINRGDGPYASQYRGVIPPPKDGDRQDSPAMSVSSNGGASSTLRDSSTRESSIASQAPPTSLVTVTKKPRKPRAPAKAKSKPPQASNADSQSTHRVRANYPPDPPPSGQSYQANNVRSPSHRNSNPPSTDAYYRHDYESQRARTRSISPTRYQYQSSRYSPPPNSRNPYHQTSTSHSDRRPNKPLRMVTILIQDMRSGTVDHQLVEVRVQLRPGDEPEDGFWADAKEISHELQSGPWRIDGPARAYTLRGKYRQIILRVSARNEDEFLPANVVVQPDRTLDLVVEMLPIPGGPPPPPMIPAELITPAYDDSTGQSERMDVDFLRDSQHTRRQVHEPVRDHRKRVNSQSFDDYDGPSAPKNQHPVLNKVPRQDYDWQQSPRQISRHTSPHRSRPSVGKDSPAPQHSYQSERSIPGSPIPERPTSAAPLPPRSPSPRAEPLYASRSDHLDDEDSEMPEDPFITSLSKLLEKEKSYIDYFRFKAKNRVVDVVNQYKFVTEHALLGKFVPDYRQPIEEHHIMEAMKINDVDFSKNYKETLHLLTLYGPGELHENADVVAMLNDQKPVSPSGNAHKRILHLLQKVDQKRRKDHPAPQPSHHYSPTSHPNSDVRSETRMDQSS